MTKQEAIEAMQKGEKVTHRYFDKNEWVALEGKNIKSEDGCKIPEIEFWLLRRYPPWDNDWSIFNSAQTS